MRHATAASEVSLLSDAGGQVHQVRREPGRESRREVAWQRRRWRRRLVEVGAGAHVQFAIERDDIPERLERCEDLPRRLNRNLVRGGDGGHRTLNVVTKLLEA